MRRHRGELPQLHDMLHVGGRLLAIRGVGLWSKLYGQVPWIQLMPVYAVLVREIMSSILRIVLLLLGASLSALVVYIGLVPILLGSATMPTLITQGVALICIGGVAGCGIAVSALAPQRLRESVILQRLFVCAALALPALDFVMFFPEAGWARYLAGHLIVSTAVAGIIALAIATAWLAYFRRTTVGD